jgi:hypothetical protein
MTREYVLLTPRMTQLRQVGWAVAASGLELEHRMERDGLHIVLHRDGAPVLTIVHPQPLPLVDEARRLLPGAPVPDDAAWWTDVVVAPGEEAAALAVVAPLAQRLGGIAVDTGQRTV